MVYGRSYDEWYDRGLEEQRRMDKEDFLTMQAENLADAEDDY